MNTYKVLKTGEKQRDMFSSNLEVCTNFRKLEKEMYIKLKIKDGGQGREGPRELGKMFLRLDVRRLPLSRERVMVVTMPTYRGRNTGRVQEVH